MILPYGELCQRCRQFTVDPEHAFSCDPLQKWSSVYVTGFLASVTGEVERMYSVAIELRVPQDATGIMLPTWYVRLWPYVAVSAGRPLYTVPQPWWWLRSISTVKRLVQDAIERRGSAEP